MWWWEILLVVSEYNHTITQSKMKKKDFFKELLKKVNKKQSMEILTLMIWHMKSCLRLKREMEVYLKDCYLVKLTKFPRKSGEDQLIRQIMMINVQYALRSLQEILKWKSWSNAIMHSIANVLISGYKHLRNALFATMN